MPNDKDTEATTLTAPQDTSASTAGVKTFGKEVGPFRVNVEWSNTVQMGDDEKEAVLAYLTKIVDTINTSDNASHAAGAITSITITPMAVEA